MSESEISLLIRLQNLDSEIDEGRKRKKILVSEIEKVEGRIKEIQEELSAKKDQLKETKKERRVKEVRIQEIDELLQKHEEEKYLSLIHI